MTLAFEPFAPADLAWVRKLIRAGEEPTPIVPHAATSMTRGRLRGAIGVEPANERRTPAFARRRLAASEVALPHRIRERINPPPQALWLFGAGHVGRARRAGAARRSASP